MTLHSHEKGATLIEVLGVLAVVATIATGMYTGISRVNQKIKLTKAQTEVADIVKAMRTQFSSFLPSSITSEQLYKIGIFKNIQDGISTNTYGTEMTMELENSGENPYFIFSYKDIPSSVCTDLLLGDWGNDPSSGLKEIKVEVAGKASVFQWEKDIRPVDPEDTTQASAPLPLLPTMATAMKACAEQVEGVKNLTISWSYYI